MEERIIDDEYGRGIRLKKTKDGYVDVTDSLADKEGKTAQSAASDNDDVDGENAEGLTADKEDLENAAEEVLKTLGEEAEESEEVTFEFPQLEKDDEELVNLSPEEAIALRKKKEEEEAARKAEYQRLCEEGEVTLISGSFRAAQLKFEKALKIAADLTEGGAEEDFSDAAVGYWRAKTSDFTQPDVLASEYLETGFESMENDLGEDALEKIKKRFQDLFLRREEELTAEETPLAKEVEEKQGKRREVLKKRIRAARVRFISAAVPAFVLLVLTCVFGSLIATRTDSLFVILTAVSGGIFAVAFGFFCAFSNKLVNALRINRANEDLSSTKEGARLLELRAYKELYARLTGQAS